MKVSCEGLVGDYEGKSTNINLLWIIDGDERYLLLLTPLFMLRIGEVTHVKGICLGVWTGGMLNFP